MRPSSKSFSSGAMVTSALLLVVLLPLMAFKLFGGIIAPDLVDSISQHVQSYATAVSASMVGGVKDAFLGIVVLVGAVYLSCVLHSVMRGNRSHVRNSKPRRVA